MRWVKTDNTLDNLVETSVPVPVYFLNTQLKM